MVVRRCMKCGSEIMITEKNGKFDVVIIPKKNPSMWYNATCYDCRIFIEQNTRRG